MISASLLPGLKRTLWLKAGLLDIRRYQTDFAGPQFASLSVQQQIQYAANQKGALGRYISGGGLKPLIGEWTLAGARLLCGDQSGASALPQVTGSLSAHVCAESDWSNRPDAHVLRCYVIR